MRRSRFLASQKNLKNLLRYYCWIGSKSKTTQMNPRAPVFLNLKTQVPGGINQIKSGKMTKPI